MYETGGSDFWLFACCVERVSRLVTPRVTRAGTASGLIQNEIQDLLGKEKNQNKCRLAISHDRGFLALAVPLIALLRRE